MSEKDIKTMDGCGPGELFNTGPNDPMNTACNYHDWRFKYDTEHPYLPRKVVDQMFLQLMLDKAAKSNLPFLLKTQAYLYYGLARAVGAFYWTKKK